MKRKKKNGSFFSPERRRKPVTISGPYVVYMLKDVDIIEDWTAIKKVMINVAVQYMATTHCVQLNMKDHILHLTKFFVLNGHCNERQPVQCDHQFLCESSNIDLPMSDH